MQRPGTGIRQVDGGAILSSGKGHVIEVVVVYPVVELNRFIDDGLGQHCAGNMYLDIPLAWNKDAVKGCDVRRLAALVELHNGDAIDDCSSLIEGQSIGDKRKDNGTGEYNAPAPTGAFQPPQNEKAHRPD